MIDSNVLLKFRTDWPGHASKWLPFPYIDTGPKVIKSTITPIETNRTYISENPTQTKLNHAKS